MSDLKRMAGGDPVYEKGETRIENKHPTPSGPMNTRPDPLAMLRAEALLVLGYDPHYNGDLSADVTKCHETNQLLAATLGRCLLRYLNQRARAN